MRRRVAVRLGALLLAALLCVPCIPPALADEYDPRYPENLAEGHLTASAAILIEQDTGQVIFEKNADERMYPASTTKILTVWLALMLGESLPEGMDTKFPVSANATNLAPDESSAKFAIGEEVRLIDLCNAAILVSGNDAATAIAEGLSGSVDAFVERMNSAAYALGCTNTHFKCASGLTTDFENHYSSAHDMAIIANHLMNIPELAEIAYTPHSYGIKPTNKHDNVQWVVSTNLLIREGEKGADGTDYFYQYCEGVKTGYLIKSGHCFAGYAKKNVGGRDYHYIVVLLNDHAPSAKDKNYAFIDAKNLFEWAFNNLYITDIYNTNVPITEIPLKLAWNKDSITLVPQDDFSTILPKGVKSTSVSKEITFVDEVAEAPIRKGQKLGTAVLTYDGEVIGRINLVASESVERSTLLAFLDWINNLFASVIFRIFLVLAVLGVAGYIFVSYSRKQRMNSLKRNVSRRKATRRTYR